MNLNIKKIKINNIITEIPEALKSGDTIAFLGRATVTEVIFKDNQDGTHNATYKAKTELVDIRNSEHKSIVDDKRIKAKSRSQAVKHKSFRVAEETGLSEEGLYSEAMEKADEYLDSKLDEMRGV
jgi:hypothetical protein